MLKAICNELATELKAAFPDLRVESRRFEVDSSYYIVVNFSRVTGAFIWFKNDTITCNIWTMTSSTDFMRSAYGDPEVFDRIQFFISEHYDAYLLDKGLSK